MRSLFTFVLITLFVGLLFFPTITKVMALEEGIMKEVVEGVKKKVVEDVKKEAVEDVKKEIEKVIP